MSQNKLDPKKGDFMLSNLGTLTKVVDSWRKHEFSEPFLKVAKIQFEKIVRRTLTKDEYETFYAEVLAAGDQIRVKLRDMDHIRSRGPLSFKTEEENSVYAWLAQQGDEGIEYICLSEFAHTFERLSISFSL